jgi:pilus assembly protein Flp/PilA
MSMLPARFARDESGGTAIEYGLIVAGMSLAIITMISGLGSKLDVALASLQSILR